MSINFQNLYLTGVDSYWIGVIYQKYKKWWSHKGNGWRNAYTGEGLKYTNWYQNGNPKFFEMQVNGSYKYEKMPVGNPVPENEQYCAELSGEYYLRWNTTVCSQLNYPICE